MPVMAIQKTGRPSLFEHTASGEDGGEDPGWCTHCAGCAEARAGREVGLASAGLPKEASRRESEENIQQVSRYRDSQWDHGGGRTEQRVACGVSCSRRVIGARGRHSGLQVRAARVALVLVREGPSRVYPIPERVTAHRGSTSNGKRALHAAASQWLAVSAWRVEHCA